MHYLFLTLAIFSLNSQAFGNVNNWTNWQEYKSFHDVEGRPVVIINYKTMLTKSGIARIKWKIRNTSTLPARSLGITQKFYQSSDGTTEIISGDSVSGKKNKPIFSGEEREFRSDLFSSEDHGEITHVELRYPFFKAEFIRSNGSILKISGSDFEKPSRGVLDCREGYSQPMTTVGFEIEELEDSKIRISSTNPSYQPNNSDLIIDIASYLQSENKRKLDKEFRGRFASYATEICGNKVKKGVIRETFNIIRAAIKSYNGSGTKKLRIKPPSYIDGIRG